jgi:hypothetical protein
MVWTFRNHLVSYLSKRCPAVLVVVQHVTERKIIINEGWLLTQSGSLDTNRPLHRRCNGHTGYFENIAQVYSITRCGL